MVTWFIRQVQVCYLVPLVTLAHAAPPPFHVARYQDHWWRHDKLYHSTDERSVVGDAAHSPSRWNVRARTCHVKEKLDVRLVSPKNVWFPFHQHHVLIGVSLILATAFNSASRVGFRELRYQRHQVTELSIKLSTNRISHVDWKLLYQAEKSVASTKKTDLLQKNVLFPISPINITFILISLFGLHKAKSVGHLFYPTLPRKTTWSNGNKTINFSTRVVFVMACPTFYSRFFPFANRLPWGIDAMPIQVLLSRTCSCQSYCRVVHLLQV